MTNKFLKKLDISYNKIGDDGCYYLYKSLKVNKTLKCIDLRINEIGIEGFECISDILRLNSSINELNIGSNIGIATVKESSKAIYEGLKKNNSLISLDVSVSFLGEEGCEWLSEGLKLNSSLRNLCFDKNYIKDGLIYLTEALKINKYLINLILSNNLIDGINFLN